MLQTEDRWNVVKDFAEKFLRKDMDNEGEGKENGAA